MDASFSLAEIEEFNNPTGSTSGDSPVMPHVNDHFGVSTYDAQPALSAASTSSQANVTASEAPTLLSAAAAPFLATSNLAQPATTTDTPPQLTLSMTSSTGNLSLSPDG